MIGIVILNYNTWNDTLNCIESIRKEQSGEQYRIYIVDNASPISADDMVLEKLISYSAHLITAQENKGYSAGNNLGIIKALEDGCTHILLSNSDVIYYPQSIKKMADYLNQNPQVGIVGPKIYCPDDSIQKSTIFEKINLKEEFLCQTKLTNFCRKTVNRCFGTSMQYENTNKVFAVSGCCFMLSRECAEKVTPLDENTFLYHEEAILGRNMLENDFLTIYYPESKVKHLGAQTTQNIKAFSYLCSVESQLYYCNKYLNASFMRLFPLWMLRTFGYLFNCLKFRSYRILLPKYIKHTWKWMF